jgi:glycosyltransferase involved in cell wall biosynthesis
MAAGKAIVASRIGQIAQILTHKQTAILVTPGDRKALSEALTTLKNDKELRINLGENARSEAFAKHSWRQRIEMITDIINNLQSVQEQ